MSIFLRSQAGILGLNLLLMVEELLLHNELADDTTIFLRASPQTLDAFSSALDIFRTAAGAHINRDKSNGFCISEEDTPNWGTDIGFN